MRIIKYDQDHIMVYMHNTNYFLHCKKETPTRIYATLFDEAGHKMATYRVMYVLPEKLYSTYCDHCHKYHEFKDILTTVMRAAKHEGLFLDDFIMSEGIPSDE